MSELMQRIREMTEREGMKRGRPFLIAMRVPDSVEYSRAIGIDLERWLSGGLIDLLITGGYFQLNDPAYSVALARKHGVKVYPSLDDPRVRDEAARKLRASTASYRGRALNAWRAGADGVYLFNSFNPADPIWRELGSAAALAAADKDYFGSVLGQGAAAGGAYPHAGFMRISKLNPAVLIAVKPGEVAAATFYVGDHFERTGAPAAEAKLRLQFKAVTPKAVTVSLNGGTLRDGHVQNGWLEFEIAPADLRAGANEVRVAVGAGGEVRTWTDLHCAVRTLLPR